MYVCPDRAEHRTREWFCNHYSVGDVVTFDYELKTHDATIDKIGSSRVTVRTMDGQDFSFSYNAHDYYNFRHFEIDLDGLFD